MTELYDQIGKGYSIGRKTDHQIAAQFYAFLDNAESILNIGAGAGSYEPPGKNLVVVEPSIEMISQRPPGSFRVVRSVADLLPFDNKSFSHSMTVLSMHHWSQRREAFKEINRVTRELFVAVTWDPQAKPFWLTRDYFPEIYQIDQNLFPGLDQLRDAFLSIDIYPLMVPSKCRDGFLAAYWARPSAYLDESVRGRISTFSRITNIDFGVQKLTDDLQTLEWYRNNSNLSNLSELDVGYKIVVCKTR